MRTPRPPYAKRSDLKKIEANWRKTRGLFKRGENSMAVVRAAISLELTANLAIRALYEPLHAPGDIDAMLLKCNGMRRKFDDHLVKKSKGLPCEAEFKALSEMAAEVNTKRNNICHMGIFVGRSDARRLIGIAHDVIAKILRKRGEVLLIMPVQ